MTADREPVGRADVAAVRIEEILSDYRPELLREMNHYHGCDRYKNENSCKADVTRVDRVIYPVVRKMLEDAADAILPLLAAERAAGAAGEREGWASWIGNRLAQERVDGAAEAWPCANYTAPVTCLSAPSSRTGRCLFCSTMANLDADYDWDSTYEAMKTAARIARETALSAPTGGAVGGEGA